jgi:hypothetical protein
MRIIKPEQLADAMEGVNPLRADEAFFVELWYSMTHQQSLDSYRVKCMNSRMIVRELAEELAIGIIKPNDIKGLSVEAIDCLSKDPVIVARFAYQWKVIEPFLNEPPQAEPDDKKRNKQKAREFTFLINDFHAALEKSYWQELSAFLPNAVATGDRDQIRIVVSHTIADLIDRGWPAESLFRWHDHFLNDKTRKQYGFEKNLSFMLRILSQPSQEFEVTLRLTGSSNVVNLEEFGDFTFKPTAEGLEAAPKKFTTRSANACVAQTKVRDSEFLSAAINAKEKFEQFIDLLRFDYEPYHLKIDPQCHVTRISDGQTDVPVVRTSTPNPTFGADHSTFSSFVEGLKTLSHRSNTEENSRRKIRGAIRQYRFGRDSENYKDKYLNWWMGLEAVANLGGESIGDSVARNVSRLMALPYLVRLLSDALTTMKYAKVDWQADLLAFCGGKELDALTLNDLFAIIQSQPHRTALLAGCDKAPTMHYRCMHLFTTLADPAKTLEKLEDHTRHLEWQLARLYRIRCCIVHGSEVRFRLSLFAANLEFYLKETIKFLITGLNYNGHIYNLEEVFARSSIAYDRVVAGLKTEGAGAEEIKQALFTNIVI